MSRQEQGTHNFMEIVQDTDKAISVMYEVSSWMKGSGMKVNQWWQPENMNRDFMLQHTEPNEYYVAIEDGKPAASVILQDSERNQDWSYIDKGNPQKALYIHWLCVARDFAGQGLSKVMVDFASEEAKRRNLPRLRLDTDADEEKLCKLYERLGFHLMGTEQEEAHRTAFYQKEVT